MGAVFYRLAAPVSRCLTLLEAQCFQQGLDVARRYRRLALALALLLAACAPAQPASQPAQPSASPTRSARPTRTQGARLPSATSAPSATLLPARAVRIERDPAEAAIASLGPLDPSRRFLTLLRDDGTAELLDLHGSRPPASLDGAPLLWTLSGQLLLYIDAASGAVDALEPTQALTLSVIPARQEPIVAAAQLPFSAAMVYITQSEQGLSLWLWESKAGSREFARIPRASLAGPPALKPGQFESLLPLPVVESGEQGQQQAIYMVDLASGALRLLGRSAHEGPAQVSWGPGGQLAFSLDGSLWIYETASNVTSRITPAGSPQDWGQRGLLVITSQGRLTLRADDGSVSELRSDGQPVSAEAAQWLTPNEVVYLRQGEIYQLKVES